MSPCLGLITVITELLLIKHTFTHTCTLASAVQNGWIIIPAIVVPFSHCSQTTFKQTHDVSVQRVVLR